jgi:NAD(P)-dependent dehydrogenase (short-subunit alcohol dehydrogenase family)
VQNKIVLVTGATNGIGFEAARALAVKGTTIVGVGRSAQKSADAARRIIRATGNDRVEFLTADLSVQAEVRKLAEDFKRKYDHLDVLLNNAGAFFATRATSQDGIEMTWALNHLNYFLLTGQLLDVLKASAPARIVNVSSAAHHRVKGIHFDDVEFTRGYRSWDAYGHSKLANILFTYELARRLRGTAVTANALHPGFVATGFGHNNSGIVNFGVHLAQRVAAKRPAEGAQTSVYLASAPDVEGVTGQYFVDSRPTRSSPATYDNVVAARLWALSEDMVSVSRTERAAA